VTLTPEKYYGSCDECHLFIECPAPRRWRISRRQMLDYALRVASVVIAALGLIRKPIPAPAPVAREIKVSDTLVLTDHFEVKEIS
jgi:hypothetical protein